MIAAERIEPESIEEAFRRMRGFIDVNHGQLPLGEARDAVARLAESTGLDTEGRRLVLELYRDGWPEHPEKAGTILVGFLLGLMARQEQDGEGEPLVDEDALEAWLSDADASGS